MDLEQLDLHPRIMAALRRAKLTSVQEVLRFSGPDLQRLTALSSPDVQHLLKAASLRLRGSKVLTALCLHRHQHCFPVQHQRLSLGCPVLDGFLRGGLPLDGITELAGCSSAGKTQLALQLCLAVQFPQRYGGLEAGAVYVCTEDTFPDRRLQQLIPRQAQLRADVPADVVRKIRFGSQIFVEHAADVDTLLECVTHKLPVLLARGMARLVVIDSVAAPFRCEFDVGASAPRARRLQSLGAALRRLSHTFQSPVLCVNQLRWQPRVPSTRPGLGQPAPHEADGREVPRSASHPRPPGSEPAGAVCPSPATLFLRLHHQLRRGAGHTWRGVQLASRCGSDQGCPWTRVAGGSMHPPTPGRTVWPPDKHPTESGGVTSST